MTSRSTLNILVVDDSPELLDITLKLLKNEGYRVSSAVDGDNCLKAIQKSIPDLVLIDIVLPDVDGRDLCKKIKSDIKLSSVFIILISSFKTSPDDVKKGLGMEADCYIRRPFDSHHLLASIRALEKIIVAKRELNEHVSRWQTTFNGVQDSIFLLDCDGRILQANRSAEVFLNKSIEEIVGQHCFELVHSATEHIDECPFIRMKQTMKRESMLLPVGDNWLEIVVDPVINNSGYLEGAVHIMKDITDRKTADDELTKRTADLQKELENKKKSEIALLELNRKLEISKQAMVNLLEDLRCEIEQRKIAQHDIRQLNIQLEERVNQRTSELKTANKELESFAFSVSHDLRAPLRAIDGFSKYLFDGLCDKIDDDNLILLRQIRNNTKKMDQLITDILALSRVARAVHMQVKVDMHKIVMAMVQEIETTYNMVARGLTIKKLPDTSADPTYIKQVWLNLISNAIKFSSQNKNPKIIIDGHIKDDTCIYSIKDNGVGFNPEYAHKLFGVFQRLHKADEFEGTGVGLAIVQRIIIKHGGKVWAEGEEGKGATFYFSLPRRL